MGGTETLRSTPCGGSFERRKRRVETRGGVRGLRAGETRASNVHERLAFASVEVAAEGRRARVSDVTASVITNRRDCARRGLVRGVHTTNTRRDFLARKSKSRMGIQSEQICVCSVREEFRARSRVRTVRRGRELKKKKNDDSSFRQCAKIHFLLIARPRRPQPHPDVSPPRPTTSSPWTP